MIIKSRTDQEIFEELCGHIKVAPGATLTLETVCEATVKALRGFVETYRTDVDCASLSSDQLGFEGLCESRRGQDCLYSAKYEDAPAKKQEYGARAQRHLRLSGAFYCLDTLTEEPNRIRTVLRGVKILTEEQITVWVR